MADTLDRPRPWAAPLLCALAATLSLPAAAQGATPRPAAYALVVGVNRGGPGQKKLRYAHRDARRLKAVLRDLGGYRANNIRLLLEPTKARLLAALGEAKRALVRARAAGQRPLFVFYYSGHARARALNIGAQELPLLALRSTLLELPATTTVAILDACQTGAISQVKGARPAADFSYNSAQDLNTAGVAVLASSSASELSQETDKLRSSYFTHHLLVALRGAADHDQDGRVTLGEAYRYAYDRTLIATAKTAVGRQHVTLETRLRGKGALVLTYPARSSAQLRLPKGLAGEILVHRPPARHVLAELYKAPGKRMRLALPPGRYVALVRPPNERQGRKRRRPRVYRCPLALSAGAATVLQLPRCREEVPTMTLTKGRLRTRTSAGFPRLALEVAVGASTARLGAYHERLGDFGFQRSSQFLDIKPALSVALGWPLGPHLSVGARFNFFDRGSYSRWLDNLEGDRHEQTFRWSSYGVGLYVRASLPLVHGIITPYAQAGAGLGFATSTFTDPLQASTIEDDQVDFGYYLSAGLGMAVMPWRHLGFFFQLDLDYAPILDNLVGDTHDSGGLRFLLLGLRGVL